MNFFAQFQVNFEISFTLLILANKYLLNYRHRLFFYPLLFLKFKKYVKNLNNYLYLFKLNI